MANYSKPPDSNEYRGIEIPGFVKLHWENKPGRWWKKGVDAVLDSPGYESMQEDAWRYSEVSE